MYKKFPRHTNETSIFFLKVILFPLKHSIFLLFTKETKQYDNMMKDG